MHGNRIYIRSLTSLYCIGKAKGEKRQEKAGKKKYQVHQLAHHDIRFCSCAIVFFSSDHCHLCCQSGGSRYRQRHRLAWRRQRCIPQKKPPSPGPTPRASSGGPRYPIGRILSRDSRRTGFRHQRDPWAWPELLCIDAKTGKEQWRKTLEPPVKDAAAKSNGQRKRTTSHPARTAGERLWIHETKPADAAKRLADLKKRTQSWGFGKTPSRTPRRHLLPYQSDRLPTLAVFNSLGWPPLRELGNQQYAQKALPAPGSTYREFPMGIPALPGSVMPIHPLVIGDTVYVLTALMPCTPTTSKQEEVVQALPQPLCRHRQGDPRTSPQKSHR